ncbi:hypothetical protein GCM10017776_05730 [Streptomyces griseoluteus]|nr:hypothetical protein GCM10017776_05730 [Streptomyces griseoluteus]
MSAGTRRGLREGLAPLTAGEGAACEMCDEVSAFGAHATGGFLPERAPRGGLRVRRRGFSRLIRRTGAVDVLAGLGALLPGYALIVPHRHTASLGELPPGELAEALSVAWQYAALIEKELGHATVLVEHGSSGAADSGGGSCIVHSHLHIFPLLNAAHSARFVAPGSRKSSEFADIVDTARRGENYYFCTWRRDEVYLLADPDLPSQFARRVWSETLELPHLWDWAAFPFLDHCADTARRLGGSADSPEEQRMRETLFAYGAAAAGYAERTRRFAAGSSMPQDIVAFARSHEGPLLDAGSGAGRDAAAFADAGKDVIALDACLPLLDLTPAHPGVRKVNGDVRALPLAGESMGSVWCSAVLLHLPPAQLLRALAEFHRVLRPGGVAHISVKEGEGHASLPIGADSAFLRHFFYYRMGDLVTLARQARFEVVRSWVEEEQDSSEDMQRWVKFWLRKTE